MDGRQALQVAIAVGGGCWVWVGVRVLEMDTIQENRYLELPDIGLMLELEVCLHSRGCDASPPLPGSKVEPGPRARFRGEKSLMYVGSRTDYSALSR